MRRIFTLKLGVVLALPFFGLSIVCPAMADPTLVTIETGAIRGVEADGVISFKGIPYAAPPVGKLRWRVPQPAKPWADVLDASAFGCSCMQTDDMLKSEDCLTLNVWRPATISNAPLPVMVWIKDEAPVSGRYRCPIPLRDPHNELPVLRRIDLKGCDPLGVYLSRTDALAVAQQLNRDPTGGRNS
jgi:Carboxylesterase family